MRQRLLPLVGLALLAFPAVAFAAENGDDEEKFNPASEWTLHEWVPIHLGPIDLSINKAVAYLLLGALLSCLIGIVFMRVKVGSDPTRQAGARRDDLRGRPGAGRRAGAPDEGDRPLVPLCRDADDLHLGDQHARVHPAAALGREGHDRGCEGADARALRRDLDAVRDARPRAHDVRLHARRGHPRERRRASTSRAGSRTSRRRCTR